MALVWSTLAAFACYAGEGEPPPTHSSQWGRPGSFLGDPPTQRPSPTGNAEQRQKLITVSKETTHVLGPLDEEGYVDYVAALNELYSKGVTPENNAAVPLWRAMGPGAIDEEDREQFYKLLGIPPLPEEGDYYVPLRECAQRYQSEGGLDEGKIEDEYALWTRFRPALSRPWTDEEFPVLAMWLDANEKTLGGIVGATRRPRFFTPLVCEHKLGTVGAFLLPYALETRTFARFLCARAMRHLALGETEEAQRDCQACHRWSRLVAQGPTLIHRLAAAAEDGLACSAHRAIAQYGNLTAPEVRRFQADLVRLPEIPPLSQAIDRCERYFCLALIQEAARTGPAGMADSIAAISFCEGDDDIDGNPFQNPSPGLRFWVSSGNVKWNEVMRMANAWYDRLGTACALPTRGKQLAGFQRLETEIADKTRHTRDAWRQNDVTTVLALCLGVIPGRITSRNMADFILVVASPSVEMVHSADDRFSANTELTRITLALAGYRAERGRYPKRLRELAPRYIDTLPKDVFSGGPFRYRREGEGYVLYSVGFNGVDDGGRDEDSDPKGHDLVVRTPPKKDP